MWFLIIPLELIFIFLFCGVAFLMNAIEGILDFLPWLALSFIFGLVYAGILILGKTYFSKSRNPLFYIASFVVFVTTILGIAFLAEPLNIDECAQWLSFFGDDLMIRIVAWFLLTALLAALGMTLAAFAPLLIQVVLLLGITVSPWFQYQYALETCTNSYSLYQTTNFSSDEQLEECTVISDAQIYYPSFDSSNIISSFLPYKYSRESFAKGEVVYLLYDNLQTATENGDEYVLVSNGNQAGYVSISQLQKNEIATHSLSVTVATDSANLYGCDPVVVFTFENGNQMIENTRTDEIIETVTKDQQVYLHESEGRYLLISIEDGTQGYIDRNDLQVIWTQL